MRYVKIQICDCKNESVHQVFKLVWYREHPLFRKYHCTAGLQFYKIGLSCFTTYKKHLSSLVKSSLVKLETSYTVILPQTVHVLCLVPKNCRVRTSILIGCLFIFNQSECSKPVCRKFTWEFNFTASFPFWTTVTSFGEISPLWQKY